jgi:hypothetical protein
MIRFVNESRPRQQSVGLWHMEILMEIKDILIPGYSYHIKDEFFHLISDPLLMTNRENGGYRPHFYCVSDENNSELFWVIPISSKTEKYKELIEQKIERYGKCNTIIMGSFSDKECAFLIQNMFPIIVKYVDHIHTIDYIPVTIHKELKTKLELNSRDVLSIYKAGNKKIIFPNVDKIKEIMLEEFSK